MTLPTPILLLCAIVAYLIYSIHLNFNPQLHDLPVPITPNTANIVKRGEKHYIIDDSLPVSTLRYLEMLSKEHTKSTTDSSAFPGKKINFKLTQHQKKEFMHQLISMDPIFNNYKIYKSFLGMQTRNIFVGNEDIMNKGIHRDFRTDAFALMAYINTVGGGTNTFTERSSDDCKIVEQFHNKRNRTVVFPSNQLHAAFYDLKAWPENVPYRLTFNVFLTKKHRTIVDRVIWIIQETIQLLFPQ